jgi:ribosome-binding protein aMBF1 (putative translation factor)
MECDICGSKEGLVKVKNEDGNLIALCPACYETHYEGYEATATAESEVSEEDDSWDDESDNAALDNDEEMDEDEPLDDDNEEDK